MFLLPEPVTKEGTEEFGLLEDGWTIVSDDKLWSAQHEHTILITDTGCEILTSLE
jgi:methionyl aminopeptidase